MGMRIIDLPAASDINDLDTLDMWDESVGYDVQLPMSALKNYIANRSNGIFKGTTTKSLDDFTAEDTGVWKWSGAAREDFPFGYAIVEIIRHEAKAGDDDNYDYIQRLNVGNAIYQRMKTATNSSNWSPMTRFDTDYAVLHGKGETDGDGSATITFPTPGFVTIPEVFITPQKGPDTNLALFPQIVLANGSQCIIKIYAQNLPINVTVPIIRLTTDGQDYGLENSSELSQFIADYCTIIPAANCSFDWFAIASKTVGG